MMHMRDIRGILGGAILLSIGLFTAFYCISTLHLGTLSEMGPGMFPVILGVLLSLLGAIGIFNALRETKSIQKIDVRSFGFLTAAVVLFSLSIRPLGLIPSIVIAIVISSRADSSLSWLGLTLLTVALALGSYLIFIYGLGMPIAAFSLPKVM